MNRRDRRQMTKQLPADQRKSVQHWLKERCDHCLIGEHQKCDAYHDKSGIIDPTRCSCACKGEDMRPKKEKPSGRTGLLKGVRERLRARRAKVRRGGPGVGR